MASLGHLVVAVRQACASTPRPLVDQTRRKLESHNPVATELVVMVENEAVSRGMQVERYLEVIQTAADKKDLRKELSQKEQEVLTQFESILKLVRMRL